MLIPAFAGAGVYGQTHKIDSLKKQFYYATAPAAKLTALADLCSQKYSLPPDSLYKYAGILKNIAAGQPDRHYAILGDYYISYSMLINGREDKSIEITDRYISQLKNDNSEYDNYMLFLQLKGLYDYRTNKKNETINVYYDLLKEAQQHNDTMSALLAKRGISLSYIINGQNQEGLNIIHDAIASIPDTTSAQYKEVYGLIIANASISFLHLHQATRLPLYADSCEYYGNLATGIGKETENLFLQCQGLVVTGLILSYKKQFSDAEAKLQQGLEVRKMIGDTLYIISDMSVLSSFYANNNQPEKGIAIAKKAIDLISGKTVSSAFLLLLYTALAENYKVAGNYKEYAETLQQLMSVKDSLNKKSAAEDLANLQIKYDEQKKENTIAQQKLKIIQSKNLLFAALSLLAFGMVLGYVFFTGYKKRQKLKQQILLEEENRQKEIAVRDAGEKERKRIAADLHDNMGAYATAIIANVDDLIVNKKNPAEKSYLSLKANALEIMSNLRDTIWASSKDQISLTGVCDRFKDYIRKILMAYPSVNVEISEAIQADVTFSAVHALNLFRILQEACTNALKYSKASLILVCFESDEYIHLAVKDNGSGISDMNYFNKGNGIRNMQARAAECGFQISISPNFPSGTVISLTNRPAA